MIPHNTTLRELHCEMNDIHLQGFTAIVDAMERNHTILYIPRMDRDRMDQMRIIKEKLCQPITPETWEQRHPDLPSKPEKKSSFRRAHKVKKVSFTEEEALTIVGVEQNLMLLEEKWESEATRLQTYLARNTTIRTSKSRNGERAMSGKRNGVNSAGSITSMGLLWGLDAR